MKICSKCGSEVDGRRCKPCRAAYQKAYYHANVDQKKKQVRRSYKNKIQRAKLLKGVIDELKDRPCADCGEKYPPWVMDFDHLRDKKGNVAHMVGAGLPLETLMKEIAKCEVVCANCHRQRTHDRLVAQ